MASLLAQLLDADKSLTAVSKKATRVKASLESDYDKIYAKATKAIISHINKSSKALSAQAESAFSNAMDSANANIEFAGFKINKVKEESTQNPEDLASFAVEAEITIKSDDDLDTTAQALDEASDYFTEYSSDEGHLVFEGYSPLNEKELGVVLCNLNGDDNTDNADELIDNCTEQLTIEGGGFADYGRGCAKVLKGKDGTYTLPIYFIVTWIVYNN